MHTAISILAAVSMYCIGYAIGRARGWREARDVVVPRLDRLSQTDRALLSSVRGGRA